MLFKSKRQTSLEAKYGPPDEKDLLELIVIGAALLPSQSAEDQANFAYSILEKYPLSHNGRVLAIKVFSSLSMESTAMETLSVGLLIYPQSEIFMRMALSMCKEATNPAIRNLVEERIVENKA